MDNVHQLTLLDNISTPKDTYTLIDSLAQNGRAAIPLIVSALDHDEAYVRRRAAQALGRIGIADEEAVNKLIVTLGDHDGEVRQAAAAALETLDPETVSNMSVLFNALNDNNPEIREMASSAIQDYINSANYL